MYEETAAPLAVAETGLFVAPVLRTLYCWDFRAVRHMEVGIKLTQIFRCLVVLKEQFQRKAAAVRETQVPGPGR